MEFEGTLCNCYRSLPCVRPRRPRWEGLRLAKRMACKSTTFYFTSLHLYIFNTHVNKICRMSPSTPLFVRGQLATSQIIFRRQLSPEYPKLKIPEKLKSLHWILSHFGLPLTCPIYLREHRTPGVGRRCVSGNMAPRNNNWSSIHRAEGNSPRSTEKIAPICWGYRRALRGRRISENVSVILCKNNDFLRGSGWNDFHVAIRFPPAAISIWKIAQIWQTNISLAEMLSSSILNFWRILEEC